jgi:hypothetical protein
VSPDDVYQVGVEYRSRALGDGFLVDPAFVVTTAEVLRGAGPVVDLRVVGAGGTIAAEVVEVLGDDGLALLEVAAPGFAVLPSPAGPEAALDRAGGPPIPVHALGDQLLRFRRLGAARLRADLNGLTPAARPESSADDQRGTLLLACLRERARTGILDPVVTVPGLSAAEGSR